MTPPAPAPARQTLGSLELGRFLAATLVFLTHFCDQLALYAAPGASSFSQLHDFFLTPQAVTYFFVLSGFVMMTAHAGDFGNAAAIPKFLWRRACRLYPCYWLSLAVVAWYLYGFLTPPYTAQLLLLAPTDFADFVPPAWTLHYEIAFYLGLAVCLLPAIGKPLLALWVAAIFWLWRPAWATQILLFPPTLWLGRLSFHWPDFFAPFEFYFFAGLLGGVTFLRARLGRATSAALLIVSLALLLSQARHLHGGADFGKPLIAPVAGLAYAGIITGLASLERSGLFRLGAWARRLGAMSYPIYITHSSIFLIFDAQIAHGMKLPAAQLALLAVLSLPALFAIFWLITFGFDQPLQRLLRGQRKGGHRLHMFGKRKLVDHGGRP